MTTYNIMSGSTTLHETNSWLRARVLAQLVSAQYGGPSGIVSDDAPRKTSVCYYGADAGETIEAAQAMLDEIPAYEEAQQEGNRVSWEAWLSLRGLSRRPYHATCPHCTKNTLHSLRGPYKSEPATQGHWRCQSCGGESTPDAILGAQVA